MCEIATVKRSILMMIVNTESNADCVKAINELSFSVFCNDMLFNVDGLDSFFEKVVN